MQFELLVLLAQPLKFFLHLQLRQISHIGWLLSQFQQIGFSSTS